MGDRSNIELWWIMIGDFSFYYIKFICSLLRIQSVDSYWVVWVPLNIGLPPSRSIFHLSNWKQLSIVYVCSFFWEQISKSSMPICGFDWTDLKTQWFIIICPLKLVISSIREYPRYHGTNLWGPENHRACGSAWNRAARSWSHLRKSWFISLQGEFPDFHLTSKWPCWFNDVKPC